MAKLILLRHGQSMWNKNNLFTGWVDVPLSPKGIEEALNAGKQIADISIDIIFTSTLMRAHQTAMLAMSEHHSQKTPVIQHTEKKLAQWGKIYSDISKKEIIPVLMSWHLNERYYGELQGCNKDEMREKYGAEQVKIWRRSYDIAPPNGESLKMTAARTLPYFNEQVVPVLQQDKNVLISAHGNSLRSIIMVLDNLSEEEVLSLELPTGVPKFYQYSNEKFVATQ